MSGLFDQPEVGFVILADRAEAIGGKLYMMGGAWDQIAVGDFAKPVMFSIALGIIIPWNATNVDHKLQVQLIDEDGTSFFRVDASFRVGRPPQLPQGASQSNVLAVPAVTVLPQPGTYSVEATLNESVSRSVSFRAFQSPHPPITTL
jgi:Family of unknown function (DUF6941)